MKVGTRPLFLLITVALFLAFFLLAISYYISGKILHPDTKDYNHTFQLELESARFSQAYYNSLPKEELYIQSPYGYPLHGIYIPKNNADKTIILVHGRTYSSMGSYKYVELFRKRGFNALLVDARYHGKSGGENSTFGYFERYDINAWVDWVLKKTGEETLIGFHGESLGSVIGMMHMTVDNHMAFYILDSPMADLSTTLKHSLEADYGLPAFPLIPLASLMSKLRGAMSFDAISPIQFMGDIEVPVFFIHGDKDQYSPLENSQQLFEAHPGPKKIWVCPNAGHTQCVTVNRSIYDENVGKFLEEIGID